LQYKGDCGVKTGADGSAFDHLARSFETQTWVYEQASGWIMWTWKTEQAADWSMVTGITYGEPPCAALNLADRRLDTFTDLVETSWVGCPSKMVVRAES